MFHAQRKQLKCCSPPAVQTIKHNKNTMHTLGTASKRYAVDITTSVPPYITEYTTPVSGTIISKHFTNLSYDHHWKNPQMTSKLFNAPIYNSNRR